MAAPLQGMELLISLISMQTEILQQLSIQLNKSEAQRVALDAEREERAVRRDAELRALAAGPSLAPRAARELLALQASDWAFLETDDLAGPYPLERFGGHLENFNAELSSVPLGEAALRNLAPTLSLAPLLEP